MSEAASATAASLQMAQRGVGRMPLVARPHDAVNLDKERAAVTEEKRKRRHFSDAQQRKLRAVYFLHLAELERWRTQRTLSVYTDSKGELHAKWEPAWPRVPWAKVAHDKTFGVFADSTERVKKWNKRFGKQLRSDIRAGRYEGKGLPAWAVRTEAPARTKPDLGRCSRSNLPAPSLRRSSGATAGQRFRHALSGRCLQAHETLSTSGARRGSDLAHLPEASQCMHIRVGALPGTCARTYAVRVFYGLYS